MIITMCVLRNIRLNQLSHYEGFTFIKADLADKDAVNDVFEQYRPTVVVNLPLKLACDIPSRILMLIFSRI